MVLVPDTDIRYHTVGMFKRMLLLFVFVEETGTRTIVLPVLYRYDTGRQDDTTLNLYLGNDFFRLQARIHPKS